jgi:hypothetical protein
MTFEEFQTLARQFALGILEPEERERFLAGRLAFGEKAEACIVESRKLNDVFALSLEPLPPEPATRQKLMALIRKESALKNRPADQGAFMQPYALASHPGDCARIMGPN